MTGRNRRRCGGAAMKIYWKAAAIFLIAGVLGSAFGIGVGFFPFPYVIPPPPAMDSLSAGERTADVANGQFSHAIPADPVDYGKGKVTVYRRTVFLEDGFEVGPGPKLHVYLVPKKAIRHSADVKGTMFLDLGRLRSFMGSQKYPIPDGVDLATIPPW